MAEGGWPRWALNCVGSLLLAGAIVFLVCALASLDLGQLVASLGLSAWVVVAAATLAYGAALILLASAWRLLSDPSDALDSRQAIAIYGPGVIAKYLPGSVFQYVSRQVLGARQGLGQKQLAKASGIEAAIHPVAALAAALAMIGGGWAGGLALAGAGLAVWRIGTGRVARAAGLQLVFFALFALIVAILGSYAVGAAQPVRLAAIFLVAWICGFLVPIAPGGIGIREAALIALAANSEGTEVVALLAVATRLVTMCGDALFGSLAYGLVLSLREKMQASG